MFPHFFCLNVRVCMTGHVDRQLIELTADRLHAQLDTAGITEANNHHRGIYIRVCAFVLTATTCSFGEKHFSQTGCKSCEQKLSHR